MRIGQGFDAHRLVPDRPLRLGGVLIPHDHGLEGHSDGDVLLHVVATSIFGALGEGDLGQHFPSSDPGLEGMDSGDLVARACGLMGERGFRIDNHDCTVIAQAPRLSPHQAAMRQGIARLLGCEAGRINVKVTSTDHLGAIGRGEGIAAMGVVLLEADSPDPE